MNFVDRDGTTLTPGQMVEVQHCVGIYGQVRRVKAELVEVNHQGIQLRLPRDGVAFNQDHGRFGLKVVKPGDLFWIALYWSYDKTFTTARGYYKHDDVEHFHETWIKVQ